MSTPTASGRPWSSTTLDLDTSLGDAVTGDRVGGRARRAAERGPARGHPRRRRGHRGALGHPHRSGPALDLTPGRGAAGRAKPGRGYPVAVLLPSTPRPAPSRSPSTTGRRSSPRPRRSTPRPRRAPRPGWPRSSPQPVGLPLADRCRRRPRSWSVHRAAGRHRHGPDPRLRGRGPAARAGQPRRPRSRRRPGRLVEPGASLLVATDARRREVYWAAVDRRRASGSSTAPPRGPGGRAARSRSALRAVGRGPLLPTRWPAYRGTTGCLRWRPGRFAVRRLAAGADLGAGEPLYLRRPMQRRCPRSTDDGGGAGDDAARSHLARPAEGRGARRALFGAHAWSGADAGWAGWPVVPAASMSPPSARTGPCRVCRPGPRRRKRRHHDRRRRPEAARCRGRSGARRRARRPRRAGGASALLLRCGTVTLRPGRSMRAHRF